ncbi:uncharacterized protein LOC130050557 [Ostrea edulis]|uniref:uncharacterized protein LOC130050557 n=1 Tax=Ostrea edulis TaxID=37623 RepID=UPI0024AF705E|nr:uncharacterized protein LOC130050557 [Ostrea edulis]
MEMATKYDKEEFKGLSNEEYCIISSQSSDNLGYPKSQVAKYNKDQIKERSNEKECVTMISNQSSDKLGCPKSQIHFPVYRSADVSWPWDGRSSIDYVTSEDAVSDCHIFGGFQVNLKEWEENIDEYVSTHYSEDVDFKLEYQESLWDSLDNENGHRGYDNVTSEDITSDVQTDGHVFGGLQVNLKEWEENIDEYVSTHYSEDVVDLKLEYQKWEENIDEYVSTNYSEDVVDLRLVDQEWKNSFDVQQQKKQDLNTKDVNNNLSTPNIQNGRQLLVDLESSSSRKMEEDIGKVTEKKNEEGQEEKEKKSEKAGRKIMQRLRNLCCCMRRKE